MKIITKISLAKMNFLRLCWDEIAILKTAGLKLFFPNFAESTDAETIVAELTYCRRLVV